MTSIPFASRLWSRDTVWAADTSDDAVLLLDEGGQVIHANETAEQLAMSLSRCSSQELADFVPETGWEVAFIQGRWRGEVLTSPGGAVLEVKAFAGVVDGICRRFVVMSDLAQRSQRVVELVRQNEELLATYGRLTNAQEQLIHAEKLASIGQLAAGVAHEINNPIGYVHSNLGTLQEYVSALIALIEGYGTVVRGIDAETTSHLRQLRERLDIDFIVGDVPKLLEESREGIERVTKIVQDLKEFSYLDRGDAMAPADVRKGLESTLNIVWNDLKYKADVEKQYADVPPVECNLSEINQVFMNLLINAGQALGDEVGKRGPRGKISLAIGSEGDSVWVSITDSGCGISEEAMPRIFDPFYTTKPIGRGTGLGLPICSRIVAKHHGRIEVQSKQGLGSTFRIVLPVKQPEAS